MTSKTSKTSSLIPFDYQGNSIRVIRDELGDPWWIAADVLRVLTLNRTAMERLDDDEKGVRSTYTLGGTQKVSVVNEPGLYMLILASRKPEAKAFQRFITHELLPTLRRSGYYALNAQPSADARNAALAALDALNDTVIQQFTALVNLSQSAHALPRKEAVRIAAKAYLLASGHDLAPLLLEPDDAVHTPRTFDAIRNGALKNPICTIARTVGPLDGAALLDLG